MVAGDTGVCVAAEQPLPGNDCTVADDELIDEIKYGARPCTKVLRTSQAEKVGNEYARIELDIRTTFSRYREYRSD
jgi:hypothetical protein